MAVQGGGKHVIGDRGEKKNPSNFSAGMPFFTQFKGKGHSASCSINVPPFMIGFQSFIKTYHAPRHKAMIKTHFFPPSVWPPVLFSNFRFTRPFRFII